MSEKSRFREFIHTNEHLCTSLFEYLETIRSEESFEFWLEVELYKRIEDKDEARRVAKHIIDEYLTRNAPHEISLLAEVRESIMKRYVFFPNDPQLFDKAQECQEDLLAHDCLPRFMETAKDLRKKEKTSTLRASGTSSLLQRYLALSKQLKTMNAYTLDFFCLIQQHKIECLETWGSKLLIGTDTCLLVYEAQQTGLSPSVAMRHTTYPISKGKPINQITAIDNLNIIVILSDGLISVFTLPALSFRYSIAATKGCHMYSVRATAHQTDLCACVKKKILIFDLNTAAATLSQDWNILEVPRSVAFCSNFVIIGYKKEYVRLYLLARDITETFPFTKLTNSLVNSLSDGTPLLLFENASVVMDDKFSKKYEITWKEPPTTIGINEIGSFSYAIALQSQAIEIKLVRRGFEVSQTFPMQNAPWKCITATGDVYVSTSNQVFRVLPATLKQKVDSLVALGEIETAIDMCTKADLPPDHFVKTTRLQELQRLHAYQLWKDAKHDRAMDLFTASNTNTLQVIGLFPGLLPEPVQQTLTYPIDIVQYAGTCQNSQRALLAYLSNQRIPHLTNLITSLSSNSLSSSQQIQQNEYRNCTDEATIIDTSFMTAFMKLNVPLLKPLLAPLLRVPNFCHVAECQQVFNSTLDRDMGAPYPFSEQEFASLKTARSELMIPYLFSMFRKEMKIEKENAESPAVIREKLKREVLKEISQDLLHRAFTLLDQEKIREAKCYLEISHEIVKGRKRDEKNVKERESEEEERIREELRMEIEEREKLSELEIQMRIEKRIEATKEEIVYAEQQANKVRSTEEREMIERQLELLQSQVKQLKEQLKSYDLRQRELEEREAAMEQREQLIGEQTKQLEELLAELVKTTNGATDTTALQQQMVAVEAGDKDVDSARRRFAGLQKAAKDAQKALILEERRQRERVEWLQKQMELYRVKGMSPAQKTFRDFLKDVKRLSYIRHQLSHTPFPLRCFISYAWEKDATENKELQKKLQKIKNDLEMAGMQVTLDVRNMKDDMKKFMVDGIEKAQKVLLICTPRLKERAAEQTKNNLQLELETALEKAKNTPEFIVPLILSGSFLDSMPPQVGHLLSICLTSLCASTPLATSVSNSLPESDYYSSLAALAPMGLIPMLLTLEDNKDYIRMHDRLFEDLDEYKIK